MKYKHSQISLFLTTLLILQSVEGFSSPLKKFHKGFFNMKGLALVSAAISVFNPETDIHVNYQNISAKCLYLSKYDYFGKLRLLANKFRLLYRSYRKIHAIHLITNRDKIMKNYLRKSFEEFSKTDLLRIKKRIYFKMKGKKMKKEKLKKWKKLLKSKRDNLIKRSGKYAALIKSILRRSFQIFYHSLKRCKIVPKVLREKTRRILKQKSRFLRVLLKNKIILTYMVKGMETISHLFYKVNSSENLDSVIENLKRIAKYYIKVIEKY